MGKISRRIFTALLFLGALYLMGPRVERPELERIFPEVPTDLNELAAWVNTNETSLGNVREGNASQIYFNDSIPQKTPYSVIYFHGFTAAPMEGAPVHRDLAKAIGANLYVPRLYGHGLEDEEPMLDFDNDKYWKSALEALQIGKHLGEKVILLATSHGGTLALSLGDDPDVVALALYSPNIAVFDPTSKILSKPWGLQIARLVKGGKYHYMYQPSEEKKLYWTTKVRLEALTHMQKFLDIQMRPKTFEKVKVPVFLGYYYKNDSLQDQVVSVPAMLKMFDQLGTPDSLKTKQAFPETGDHVMTSYITTSKYDQITQATLVFLQQHLGL